MNAPTIARAHLSIDLNLPDGDAGCCHDDNPSNLPNCAKSQTGVASAREHLALSHLTEAQALATWERFKAVQKAYVAAILAEVAE